ncbi:hypothetical protein MHYP_G00068510 [Metynnis hypsauchen]
MPYAIARSIAKETDQSLVTDLDTRQSASKMSQSTVQQRLQEIWQSLAFKYGGLGPSGPMTTPLSDAFTEQIHYWSWSCSEACNRNTMSEAGENSQAKLSVSSPVPGCEILGLTSSLLTEGGKSGLGGGCKARKEALSESSMCRSREGCNRERWVCSNRYVVFP